MKTCGLCAAFTPASVLRRPVCGFRQEHSAQQGAAAAGQPGMNELSSAIDSLGGRSSGRTPAGYTS